MEGSTYVYLRFYKCGEEVFRDFVSHVEITDDVYDRYEVKLVPNFSRFDGKGVEAYLIFYKNGVEVLSHYVALFIVGSKEYDRIKVHLERIYKYIDSDEDFDCGDDDKWVDMV